MGLFLLLTFVHVGALLAKQLTKEPFLAWGSAGDLVGICWGFAAVLGDLPQNA